MNRIDLDPKTAYTENAGTNNLRRSPGHKDLSSLFGKELKRSSSETDLLTNKVALNQLQNLG
jgi:hypothetical protein